ncbi:MAG: hypothetical protein JNK58_08225 [Phycisphaerae bacterium]|nr:hypothetical protein [Phycisphaerae bacterium]
MRRDPIDVIGDDQGQLSVEYVLGLLAFVVPMFALAPVIFQQIYAYFYQIAGLLALPFA